MVATTAYDGSALLIIAHFTKDWTICYVFSQSALFRFDHLVKLFAVPSQGSVPILHRLELDLLYLVFLAQNSDRLFERRGGHL